MGRYSYKPFLVRRDAELVRRLEDATLLANATVAWSARQLQVRRNRRLGIYLH
jgi:hypothetical protein